MPQHIKGNTSALGTTALAVCCGSVRQAAMAHLTYCQEKGIVADRGLPVDSPRILARGVPYLASRVRGGKSSGVEWQEENRVGLAF